MHALNFITGFFFPKRLPGHAIEHIPSAARKSDAEPDAAAIAPALREVMRDSRARAWIPPHLIESLGKGSK